MEFRDLKRQYQAQEEEINAAVMDVLYHANFISGNENTELEARLAKYVGVKHCITCGNGTDALILALMVWNIGKNDAVFVPDFTFFASGEAPAFLGATPIFVDVERDTFNISPEKLEEAIEYVQAYTDLTPKVILAVDLFGQPADYMKIKKIAEKYGLLILEDGAQGFGGAIGEKKACSFGDISTTSFFPAKPLGCYGDGGAIFTDNDEWAEVIRSLCVHGKGKDKYDNVRIGMNSRLDTIQAAILLVKLRHFIGYELQQVNRVAEKYTEILDNIVVTPKIKNGFYSSWAQYTIMCKDSMEREKLQKKLKEAGIPSMIYYAKGMHEQEAFNRQEVVGECIYQNSMYIKERVLSLPISPYTKKEDIKTIKSIMKGLVK